MRNINFKRILGTAIIVFILMLASVYLIITAYAFILAYHIQGAPDSQKIAAFSIRYAPLITLISSMLFTFFASVWTARKVDYNTTLHCFLIAVIVSVLIIIYSMLYSQLGWYALITGLAIIIVSFPGAKTGMMIGKKRPQADT